MDPRVIPALIHLKRGIPMEINVVRFDMALGHQKPENIIHQENDCPFCHPETLTDIIDTEDEFIFLRNKYNVLENADQFVLVEAASCGIDMPDYSLDHMTRLLHFGIRHWQRLQASGAYEAVIFFKNHGHLSGGTMRHPHMQIVGFQRIHPTLLTDRDSFQGVTVLERNNVLLNASTHPRIGFGEFNIIAPPNAVDTLADFLQKTIAFIRDRFPRSQDSYNLFFYSLDDKIAVKALPRFPTSPLLVGYDIRLLPSNFEKTVAQLRQRFPEL